MIQAQDNLITMSMNNKNLEKDNSFIRNIVNLIVLICAIIGLLFSVIGLLRFVNQKILFIIGISGSSLAILVTIYDLFLKDKNKKDWFRIILVILSGIFSVWVCIFVVFYMESSLFLKSVAIFGIVFFSIAIIKGLLKLKKTVRTS